jgi:hypothetical protein
MGAGYGGYLDLVKSIKLPETEWDPFCQWKENRYTRNCISSCDEYELMLMCWGKDHRSPIHSYDFQESWIKVLKGELTIEVYRVDREKKVAELDYEMIIRENEYTYLNDNMGFHRIKNSSPENTISLHLNIEKVNQWEVFHDCKNEIEVVQPKYDSYSLDCVE